MDTGIQMKLSIRPKVAERVDCFLLIKTFCDPSIEIYKKKFQDRYTFLLKWLKRRNYGVTGQVGLGKRADSLLFS